MRICFSNSDWVSFDLLGSVAPALERMYRHLQHVALPWRPWDAPLYPHDPIEQLVRAGQALGLTVDAAQCSSQAYFNHLHELYEHGYNGDSAWMDYHELIHVSEKSLGNRNILLLDHRELAGLLEQPFDQNWMQHGITCVPAGTVFVQWAELGKSPYVYWRNQEPSDLSRLCELAKPWLKLRGRMGVAMHGIDFMDRIDQIGFNTWWQGFEKDWCDHWKIDSWTLEHQRSVVPIGSIDPDSVDQMHQWLHKGHYPTHVRL